MNHEDALQSLIDLTHKMIKNDPDSPAAFDHFLSQAGVTDARVLELAEALNFLHVQKEVYIFRLESIIEHHIQVQKELEEAMHDPLTGLPNRKMFHGLLEQTCHNAQDDDQVALMFVDLDKFKQVNDTLGHDAGDELLILATKRMKQCTKEHDIIARLGGDEFTIIVPHIKSVADVADIAQRIIDHIREACHLTQGVAHIGASIGISLYPCDANSTVGLLKNADIAMYKAKAGGRNRYEFYQNRYE
jgi:diguanylate cyclase (GGDEF)-like protein